MNKERQLRVAAIESDIATRRKKMRLFYNSARCQKQIRFWNNRSSVEQGIWRGLTNEIIL